METIMKRLSLNYTCVETWCALTDLTEVNDRVCVVRVDLDQADIILKQIYKHGYSI